MAKVDQLPPTSPKRPFVAAAARLARPL